MDDTAVALVTNHRNGQSQALTTLSGIFAGHQEYSAQLLERLKAGDRETAAHGLRLSYDWLRNWKTLEDRAIHAKAVDLRMLELGFDVAGREEVWAFFKETGYGLDKPDNLPFNYSFIQMACTVSGLDDATVRNYTRVAKVWLTGETPLNIPHPVTLYDHHTGKPVADTDGVIQTVEWNPLVVDFSKLLIACVPARDGKMTDIHWGLLANPATPLSALHLYFGVGVQPWDYAPAPDALVKRRVAINAGVGYVYTLDQPNGKLFATFEMDSDDPDIEWAIETTLKALNAKVNG